MPQLRELPQAFQEHVIVFDGAMGSLLHERGANASRPFEELNLTSPHLVCQVHAEYIQAGANAIETNTFAANRFRLARYGLEDKVFELNSAGARLARNVAGGNVVVAGSVGPLGVRLAPLGTVSAEEVKSAVGEQVRGLVDGGVDLILLETQSDLDVVCAMLDAVFEVSELPVICQFTVGTDLVTSSGDTLDDIVLRLSDYPVSALGVNCSIGPEGTLRAVQALSEITELPISAQPNSGFPANVDGRTLFISGANYFAERGAEIVQAGASIIGGCCGTTPAHIEALASRVKELKRPVRSVVHAPRRREITAQGTCERSPLLRKMTGGFVTVEVTPPKDTNYHVLIEKLRPLVDAGISAIDVTDNPMASMHMSAIAFAHLVKEELGIATILHLTCRDLNLLGMHSALLGAAALGIDGILALTGDPASVGDFPGATSVFDVTSDGLAKIISSLNCGVDYVGKEIGQPTSFAIGAAFNPLAEDMAKELGRLAKKREAGADFLMTQPVFDIDALKTAAKMLPSDWNPPILVGVLPLRSTRHAEFLHNEVPGMTIPDDIRAKLASVDAESAKAIGAQYARDIYLAARESFGGVYFMPPFNNYEAIREVIVGA
jgi:methionine synthase I (cobalamin-dependent)/5,10-methylenetetrahydrofolate reductase